MSWGAMIGGFATLWAWATLCVAMVSVYTRWQLGKAQQQQTAPSSAASTLRALMIRPCAGIEEHLELCLKSYAHAQRPDKIDLILAVDSEKDPAWPTVQRVCAELQAQGLAVNARVVSQKGANRKAAILACVMAEQTHAYDVVINADSNVDLSGFDITLLMRSFAKSPHLGALWVPAIEASEYHSVGNLASEAVLSGSLHAFPLLCGLDQKGLVGKLFSVHTSALKEIGGFQMLVDYLGEDFELARRLACAGYTAKPITAVAQCRSGFKSFWDTVSRHARWITVIRAQRPGHLISYPLWFFPLPMIALLAGLAVFGSAKALGWLALCVALLARSMVALSARRFSNLTWSVTTLPRDILLADTVLALAWVKALASRNVSWRGRVLRLDHSGRIKTVSKTMES